MTEAARAAETAARASYGKLLAILASRSHDIASAEDALADAFAKALANWPMTGIPDRPEAWLLTAARNRLTDTLRRDSKLVPYDDPPVLSDDTDADALPDRRLGLLFVCAHPAIDRRLHTPLMLQTVLGIEAADIARAFVVSPGAMAQRLVRAKSKIKASGMPFRLPDPQDLQPRLQAVLEAIYGVYALDWLKGGDALTGEALYLSMLLARLMPDEPEPLGLAALIGFGQSRQTARVHDGVLVPLHEQDTGLWDGALIDQSAHLLSRAQSMGRIGRFQIEAAIQSVHAHRATTGMTNWAALIQLYAALIRLYPTLGAQVSHAAAVAQVNGSAAGLALLDGIDPGTISGFQPYFATRAHLLAQQGSVTRARATLERAIDLSTDLPLRRHLQDRLQSLGTGAQSDPCKPEKTR